MLSGERQQRPDLCLIECSVARFLDGPRADGRSPDLSVRNLRPGDRFLLCSDGLSEVVPRDLVRETLLASNTPADAADHLIVPALDHGGPDNITVLVIDVQDTRG